ncbi:MAG: UDP-N-acetylmuramoyl-tripeptide--D-alanyl-D-alanine ligase [Clostridia bacterium]|nr:UDP-N-acetylmuramoyl-tripeptide--D-alanyl-D-alanine ligase [Clostridia bacterium]
MIYLAIITAFALISGALLTVMSFKIMQILQLSSYRVKGVAQWFKSTKFDYMVRYFAAAFFATVCMLVYVGCFGKFIYAEWIGMALFFLNMMAFAIIEGKQRKKTPLRFTPRIIRLTALSFVLFSAAAFGLLFAGKYIIVKYSLVGLLPLIVPFIVIAAHFVLLPFETLNNARYVRKAKKKLAAMPMLIKIGITGSFGKTTAKNILAAMLEKKYSVFATPSSYNTPLGIARSVNGGLQSSHGVFIAEMGARHAGDIAELTRLVAPNIGVLTAVGNQHLATFGSVENVAAAKYELIEGLGANGLAAFSCDNEYTLDMYGRTEGKKLLAGSGECDEAQVKYSAVSFGPFGTELTLLAGDESVKIRTSLLGRHIPSLVSLCAAVSLELGVSLKDIAVAVEDLPQVEHRLQLIKNGDVTVIDDAYNSNTQGAKNALEVLREFDGTRIIITPGLVELGEEEENANYDLGRSVTGCADYAYFVGARAQTLKNGAIDSGMDENKVFVCGSLAEAVEKSGAIGGKKTVLFENDLPDNL